MSEKGHENSMSLGVIRLTGPDAASFLQSQLTADVEDMETGVLQPAAWCSPDGRAQAVMLVLNAGKQWLLVLPETLRDPVAQRLNLFRIGRDVSILPAGAARPAGTADSGVPLAYAPARRLVVDAEDAPAPLPEDWLVADIVGRMPWLLSDTAGEFLPQMLGLETLGGLSYGKGCYPGQEVIARVHYRGRVKRVLRAFELASGPPPSPGTELGLDGHSGTVLYAATADGETGTSAGLAVVPVDAAEDGAVRVGEQRGRLVAPEAMC